MEIDEENTNESVFVEPEECEIENSQETYSFEELLKQADIDPSDFSGESFTEFAVLLCGIGLTMKEMKLFIKRNISLEAAFQLTDSDLEIIGISSPSRRLKILEGFRNLNPKKTLQEGPLKVERISCGNMNPQEAQKLILLETNHLEQLALVLELLKNAVAENYEDIYLDNFSGKAIVSVLLKIAIDQAQVLKENVHNIPYNLSEVKKTKHSGICWKNVFVSVLTVTAVLSFAMWGFRKNMQFFIR